MEGLREETANPAADLTLEQRGISSKKNTKPLFRRPSLKFNFFRCVMLYLFALSLVGGGVICAFSPEVLYLDGLFLAVSACTGTGLATVEMNLLNTGSFVTIFLLMYLGGTVVLLVPPMIYRRAVFAKIYPKLRAFIDREGSTDKPSVNALVSVLRKRELLHRALAMMMLAVILYLFLWLFCGGFIMYAITLQYPHPPELVSRGFSKLWTAFFLTFSAFFNCGYTLTSDRYSCASILPLTISPPISTSKL